MLNSRTINMIRDKCRTLESTIFILTILLAPGYAYQYLLVMDESIFTPCKDYPDNYLTKYVTLPQNLSVLADDSFYVAGDVTVIFDFQRKKYPVSTQKKSLLSCDEQ